MVPVNRSRCATLRSTARRLRRIIRAGGFRHPHCGGKAPAGGCSIITANAISRRCAIARAPARAEGLQIVWTLFHYGWPTDLDVFSAEFVERFARYARAAAAYLGEFTDGVPVYAPISEISFLTWAAGTAGASRMHNAAIAGRSDEFKCQLVRAAIAACEAILEVDPRARFLNTDPLMHVVAPPGRPDLASAVQQQRELQFETWDMLARPRAPGTRRPSALPRYHRHQLLLGQPVGIRHAAGR